MKTAKNKPNILFIMTDQHRADYLGCYGADFIKTPALDKIALQGVRFDNCFTNSPLCAPARIGLATGLQPCRLGSLNNSSYLPLSHPTYYQRLRDNGYLVGCAGKLDLVKPSKDIGISGMRPSAYSLGFTHPYECEGKMEASNSETPRGPYGHFLQKQGLFDKFRNDYVKRRKQGWTAGADHDSALSEECYEDSYIGRKAVEWLENIDTEYPWHYFVSFVGPHDPYDPPSSFGEKYREAIVPDPIPCVRDNKPSWVQKQQKKQDTESIRHVRRQYCGEIELIDSCIMGIISVLEKRGMMDNTYIVFASDHGDMLGDHGMFQKSKPYESAINVPLIVSGPGIQNNCVSEALVELIDINPTICRLAGIADQENIDAKPFDGILFNRTRKHRSNVVTAMGNFKCIRTDEYKYVVNYNDVPELYALKKDPTELNNIAAENPELVGKFSKILLNRYMEGGLLR